MDVTRLNFFEVARAAFFSKYNISPKHEVRSSARRISPLTMVKHAVRRSNALRRATISPCLDFKFMGACSQPCGTSDFLVIGLSTSFLFSRQAFSHFSLYQPLSLLRTSWLFGMRMGTFFKTIVSLNAPGSNALSMSGTRSAQVSLLYISMSNNLW